MPGELEFESRGIRLAACTWGEEGAHQVLAIHGWLDNAGSFARLAPLLRSCRVVAPDLAGHALSEDRPPQAGYNIWDDLPDLLALADELGWERFSLLGHSRGAAVASLLAATSPGRVDALLLLDNFLPATEEPENVIRQLGAYLRECLTPPPLARSSANFDAALAHRVRKSGCSLETARLLAARGLRQNADGRWQWRHDPRVMSASAMKFSEAQNRALLDALQAPVLGLLAEGGLGQMPQVCRQFEDYGKAQWEILPGSHHFHTGEEAASIAAKIEDFLRLQQLLA